MKHGMKKLLALLLLAGCLSLLGAGPALAVLITQSYDVENVFDVAKSSVDIYEEFTSTKKTDVKILNDEDSDMPVYVRARVLVTWKNNNGDVAPRLPQEGKDYYVTWGSWKNTPPAADNKWFAVGDTYYYASPLDPGEMTANLIDECTSEDDSTPSGYALHVEIVASSMQTTPPEAVEQAWKDVKVVNGELQPK